MRAQVEKEKEKPIKPKKVCRICGKALSLINGEGACFTHFYYESQKEEEPKKPKRVRKKKNGKSNSSRSRQTNISMQGL